MNDLVFVDARAGELEKILSGVKTMIVKEFSLMQANTRAIQPGDSLYFLRDQNDCALRVKATVARIHFIANKDDLSQILKVMQPRLHLTEDQYNHWSRQQRALLVEFESAQKIGMIHVSPEKTSDRSGWIAFEDFNWISEQEVI